MGKYNKAFGSIIGGVISLGVSFGLMDQPDPQVVVALTAVLSTIGTYFAPANRT